MGLVQLVVDKICSWTVSRFPSTRGIFQSIIKHVNGWGGFAAKAYVVAHPIGVMPKDVLEPCLVSTELWEDKAAPCHTCLYAMVDALGEFSQYWVERLRDTPNTFWLNHKQQPSWQSCRSWTKQWNVERNTNDFVGGIVYDSNVGLISVKPKGPA